MGAKFLLVGHQTACSAELACAAQEVLAENPAAVFVLLVPATPIAHLLVWEEAESVSAAVSRADQARRHLVASGVPVIHAVVGDANPLFAIDDEIRGPGGYNGIIIATFPPRLSRWLGMDIPRRVRRAYPHLDVRHVVAAARTVGPNASPALRFTRAEETKAERA